ncbi:21697_t:CDS:2, partial [Gigaspora rosea]
FSFFGTFWALRVCAFEGFIFLVDFFVLDSLFCFVIVFVAFCRVVAWDMGVVRRWCRYDYNFVVSAITTAILLLCSTKFFGCTILC